MSELYLHTRRSLMSCEDQQTASLYARNILCRITGKTQEALLADGEKFVSDEICQAADNALARLLNGEPIAYVLGQWDFYGMTLLVDNHVLIPRDDTCAVVSLAIQKALSLDNPRVLDLCTGTGCIGLALASRVKDAQVILADISQDAIDVANKNIALHKLSDRVTCVRADALEEAPGSLGEFDIIISNPPYITTEEMQSLPPEVKNFEPHLALHGGEDGLKFYRGITKNFRNALKPGGYLCFEYGIGQGADVCGILEMNGYTILERTRDYQHIERAVIAQYGRKEK